MQDLMKYFTPELYLEFQTDDWAGEKWENALNLYLANKNKQWTSSSNTFF